MREREPRAIQLFSSFAGHLDHLPLQRRAFLALPKRCGADVGRRVVDVHPHRPCENGRMVAVAPHVEVHFAPVLFPRLGIIHQRIAKIGSSGCGHRAAHAFSIKFVQETVVEYRSIAPVPPPKLRMRLNLPDVVADQLIK